MQIHNLQNDSYFIQLNESIGDKQRIIDWVKGSKVLDAGCGSGMLTIYLFCQGYDVKGVDLSLLSYKYMSEMGMANNFVHGNLLDLSMYFEKESLDTIIFSSVLHEVFSYNDFKHGKVSFTIENAMKLLKQGGRIIIRDGVKSREFNKRIIRFKDVNDILFLTEYCRRFKGRNIRYNQIDDMTFEMSGDDAMEFLYTYTWGWESFDREVEEQYGVMSMDKYVELLERCGGKIVHAEEYLQEGYQKNLEKKIEFYDNNMNSAPLPNSNMLLVVEKVH